MLHFRDHWTRSYTTDMDKPGGIQPFKRWVNVGKKSFNMITGIKIVFTMRVENLLQFFNCTYVTL